MRFLLSLFSKLAVLLLMFLIVIHPKSPDTIPPHWGLDYVETMTAKHDCWTGKSPNVPGHVVAAKRGDIVAHYYGSKVVAQTLTDVFGNEPSGITVYAYCK